MDERERAELEKAFVAHLARGESNEAVALAVRGYGPEIYALLATLAHPPVLAEDAFAIFCEDLFRAAATFNPARASLRTWSYVIARHAFSRARHAEHRHASRRTDLETKLVETLLAEARESTASYLRTDIREGVGRLRATLSPEDQTLLYLRVERSMPWSEIVEIVRSPDDDPVRASARLRKQFERACARLRVMAAREGLRG